MGSPLQSILPPLVTSLQRGAPYSECPWAEVHWSLPWFPISSTNPSVVAAEKTITPFFKSRAAKNSESLSLTYVQFYSLTHPKLASHADQSQLLRVDLWLLGGFREQRLDEGVFTHSDQLLQTGVECIIVLVQKLCLKGKDLVSTAKLRTYIPGLSIQLAKWLFRGPD